MYGTDIPSAIFGSLTSAMMQFYVYKSGSKGGSESAGLEKEKKGEGVCGWTGEQVQR